MEAPKKLSRRIAFFILVVSAALALALHLLNIDDVYLRFQLNLVRLPEKESDIVLILAGNRSMTELRQWPWPRSTYTALLNDHLAEARSIVLDILFAEPGAPEEDRQLAEAIRAHGGVVLAQVYDSSVRPLAALSEAAAAVGYANSFNDQGSMTYRHTLALPSPGGMYPSLVGAGLAVHGNLLSLIRSEARLRDASGTEVLLPLDEQLRYWKPPVPHGAYALHEFSDVMNGQLSPDAFRDKLVFVGISATGATDVVFSAAGPLSGAQFLADSAYVALTVFNPLPAPFLSRFLYTLFFSFLCGVLVYRFSWKLSWLLPLGCGAAAFAISQGLFQANLAYLPSFPALAGSGGCYLFVVLLNYASSQRDLKIHMLPSQGLLSLGKSAAAGERKSFSHYLSVLSGDLEKTAKARILRANMTANSAEYRGLQESHPVLEEPIEGYVLLRDPLDLQRNRMLITLPRFDAQNEQEYALLSVPRHLDDQAARSIVMLIFFTAAYYSAIDESGKRQQLFYDMIQCMVSAIDAKDPITAGHSQRVSQVTAELAEAMGLEADLVENLRFAGLIHDIGKIGIEDAVLNKPGVFSESEFARMKEHPAKGYGIMSQVHMPQILLDGILEHHERLDGRGYPQGKREAELSLAGRIIKVADVYDALISERQYKKTWPLERVCNVLYQGRGSEFDARIVDLLLARIKPPGWLPPETPPVAKAKPGSLYEQGLSLTADLIARAKPQHGSPLRGSCPGPADLTDRGGFCELEWGEGLQSRSWLRYNAELLDDDPAGDRFLYGCASQDPRFGSIYFDFLRGFLCSGAVEIIDPDSLEALGDPTARLEADISVWDRGALLLYLLPASDSAPPRLCFILKYLCDEK